jgi:hypothetical protein
MTNLASDTRTNHASRAPAIETLQLAIEAANIERGKARLA